MTTSSGDAFSVTRWRVPVSLPGRLYRPLFPARANATASGSRPDARRSERGEASPDVRPPHRTRHTGATIAATAPLDAAKNASPSVSRRARCGAAES